MDDGVEGEAVAPAGAKVDDIDVRIAARRLARPLHQPLLQLVPLDHRVRWLKRA